MGQFFKIIQTASCHPYVQKHIHPTVQYVWNFFPLNYLLGRCTPILDSIICPIFFCCYPCFGGCSTMWNCCCFGPVSVIGGCALLSFPFVFLLSFMITWIGTW